MVMTERKSSYPLPDSTPPWERPDIVEAAQRLGISPRNLWRLRQRSPVTHEGRRWPGDWIPQGSLPLDILREIDERRRTKTDEFGS